MERQQIEQILNEEIAKWSQLQGLQGYSVEFTNQAIEIVISLIQNLQNDPPRRYKQADYDSTQRLAISLVPNALNELIPYLRIRSRRERGYITINSWDIYRSLSESIMSFCFIDEDDM